MWSRIKKNPLLATIIGFTIFLVLSPVWFIPLYRHSEQTVVITVVSKERIAEKNSGKYLVYTKGEVFEVTDTVSYWRFDSSELYGELGEGKSYRCKISGWRVPFFSWYRNIIEIERFEEV